MLRTTKQLNPRVKVILAMAGFAVVFTALTVIATYYDLAISKLLTKHSLTPIAFGQEHGDYISHNSFALFFEALGSCPIYLMASVVGAIVFWYFARRERKVLYIVAAIGAVVTVAGLAMTVKDLFNYTAEYIGASLGADIIAAKAASNSIYIKALAAVVAIPPAAMMLLLWRRIPREVNDKMIWWALAILGAIACYLIPNFVKGPVGRVRFRTMNYLGDTEYELFTPWYVMNGKRVMTAAGIVASTPETKAAIVVASDACKSFPSGHTFSAGLVYSLLALPYLSEKCNTRGVKLGLWLGTVAYTGIVAVSRIVAGAHYMSDVLFGGTISFLAGMIMREIFVCRGSHFRALFGKAVPATAGEAPAQAVEAEAADTAAVDSSDGEE